MQVSWFGSSIAVEQGYSRDWRKTYETTPQSSTPSFIPNFYVVAL